ncbi:MAG: Type 1 glutamine amidotransferase-like domain-containing protein [Candidatus Magasanikbacteria bacterium]|nr:Type 1 glutamine amidotransferase-like domain-containing protein [Candidatus Magasanikbacteria bacterium]
MKTIILASSSEFIASTIDNFLPKPLSESKVLYVTTASKKVNDDSYVEKTRQKIGELSFSYTEIDIAGKTEEELKKALTSCDIVYVEGGNTFYLLKAVRESGFEKAVKEAMDKGIVYWGVSAGSYIACPSIVMATWSDRFDRFGVTDWSAMNLVPFLIKAHYAPKYLDSIKRNAKDLQLPMRMLNDNQAIIVRDGEVQLIGEGDDITL